MATLTDIITLYVCPSLASIITNLVYLAPGQDLVEALRKGSLGPLNPFPWAIMTGMAAGWLIYGYYLEDPFLLAGNFLGFVFSFWLNMGAAKLQYLEVHRKVQPLRHDSSCITEDNGRDASPLLGSEDDKTMILVPQERTFLIMMGLWCIILIWTSLLYPAGMDPSIPVGIFVNINFVAFCGSPLQTLGTVIETKDSKSIHRGTMIMNALNCTFWLIYGVALGNVIIIVANSLAMSLVLAQIFFCFLYPNGVEGTVNETTPISIDFH